MHAFHISRQPGKAPQHTKQLFTCSVSAKVLVAHVGTQHKNMEASNSVLFAILLNTCKVQLKFTLTCNIFK